MNRPPAVDQPEAAGEPVRLSARQRATLAAGVAGGGGRTWSAELHTGPGGFTLRVVLLSQGPGEAAARTEPGGWGLPYGTHLSREAYRARCERVLARVRAELAALQAGAQDG